KTRMMLARLQARHGVLPRLHPLKREKTMAPIKMPTQSGATKTSGSSADDTKIRLEEMKSNSMKVQGALDIAKESLRVANSFLEVIRSNQQLQAKREEWEHRVAEAQKNVEKA